MRYIERGMGRSTCVVTLAVAKGRSGRRRDHLRLRADVKEPSARIVLKDDEQPVRPGRRRRRRFRNLVPAGDSCGSSTRRGGCCSCPRRQEPETPSRWRGPDLEGIGNVIDVTAGGEHRGGDPATTPSVGLVQGIDDVGKDGSFIATVQSNTTTATGTDRCRLRGNGWSASTTLASCSARAAPG